MEYEDLWPDSIENQYVSTENISAIMKQQAAYLKEKSQGKVFLRFGHIKEVSSFAALEAGIINLSAVTRIQASSEYIDNSNIDELKDANELYSQKRFGCEIYNQMYRFRLFEMNFSPLYPIDVCIDEGIVSNIKGQYLTEAFGEDTLQVNDDNEFIELLKSVFSSKKVAYILTRLMEDEQ